MDRVLALLDGDVAALARLTKRAEPTVYAWRRDEVLGGRNGFFPDPVIADVREGLKALGWVLPKGFLTEPGAFARPPRDGGEDEA